MCAIKYEFTFLYEWNSFSDLKEGLESFINSYNKVRPHESLGYQTPDEVKFIEMDVSLKRDTQRRKQR